MNITQLKADTARAIEHHEDDIVGVAKHVCHNPEPGYFEYKTSEFVQEKLEGLGLSPTNSHARTGVKAVASCGMGSGPSVALMGELDSLRVANHPEADPTTGAAHACGHHCQLGSMYGALLGLILGGAIQQLWGRVAAIAVPAEEYIDLRERLELRDKGEIEFLGGKQELIKLGLLDDVDMALLCHTAWDAEMPNEAAFAVGGTSNGHVAKLVEYFGVGAHAGEAPNMGINALNAAMLGISAVHANRETFKDNDNVRVHGVLVNGGEAVSAIPAEVTLEWRVRASNSEAIAAQSKNVDRAFKAGALAVGAKLRITNIPGYLPLHNNGLLEQLFVENASDLVGSSRVLVWPSSHNPGSSTDMGDLSHIMPVLHAYSSGTSGTPHASDYVVTDYRRAVVDPAIVMAMTVIDLLSEDARQAKKVLTTRDKMMTREQYLTLQRGLSHVVSFDPGDV